MAQATEKPTQKRHISPFWLEVLQLALLALLYAATVRVGLLTIVKPEGISSFWPASGVALASLLFSHRKRWPRILAVLFSINLLGNLTSGNTLPVSLSFALINFLESFLSAWVITYFRKSRLTFETTADVFALAGVAFFVNGFTAMLSAAVSAMFLGAPFFDVWRVWWVSNGLGMVLITSVVITWAVNPSFRWPQISIRQIEAPVLIIIVIVFSVLVFGPFTNSQNPILQAYMLFPLLVWLAFRFSPRSMTSALLLVTGIAFWGTLQHNGIFAYQKENQTEELIYLQIYINVMVFSGLLLGAMVAERKHDLETIKKAESNYRSILENAPIGFFQSYPNGGYRSINPRMAQIFGFASPQEMLNSITDITEQIYATPSPRQAFQSEIAENGRVVDFITQHRHKDTSLFWTSTNARAITNEQGQVLYFEGFILDIDERITAEQRLRESEERYQNILTNAPIGFFQSTFDGRFQTVNPKMAQIFGYNSPAEMIESIKDIGSQLYGNKTSQEKGRQILAKTGQVTNFINEHRRKDNSIFWANINARIVKNRDNQPLYFEGFIQDIDERIQAEKALQESHQFVQATMDSLSAHICVLEADGTILAVNKAWMDFAGQNPPVAGNVSVGVNYLTICDNTTGPEAKMARAFAAGIRAVLAGESETFYQEYPCHAPHEQRWFMGRVLRFADETSNRVVIAHENITERRQVENALRESETSLKFSQQVAHLGHWTWDAITDQVTFSDEMYRIFGRDPETFNGNLDAIIAEAVHPEDREKVIQSRNSTYNEQKPIPIEHRIIRPDQSIRTVWSEAGETICDADGKIIKLHGILQDITERKQVEDALRESEASLKLSQQITHVGHWTWNAKTDHVTWSDEMYRIYGLDPATFDGNLYELVRQTVHPEDRETINQSRNNVFNNQQAMHSFEHRIIRPDQSIRTVWTKSAESIVDSNGEIVQLSGVLQDITERKQAENALRESEASLKLSQKIAHVGHWTWDTITNQLVWSDELYRIMGIDRDSFDGDLNTVITEFIHPEDREKVIASNTKVITEQKPEPLEYRIIRPDQSIRILWAEAGENIYDGNGKIIKLSGIVQDITEHKRVENALRESEKFAVSIADNVPSMLAYWTNDLFCIFANKEYLTWFGRTREQIANISAQELLGEDLFKQNEPYMRAALRGEPQQFERMMTKPNGTINYVWAQYTPHYVNDQIEGFFVLATDITQIKQNQERLRISEEKWRSLFAILPVGISLLDAERQLVDFNPALEKIMEMSADGIRAGAYTRRKYLRANGSPMPPEEFPSARAIKEQTVIQSAQMGIVKENNQLIWVEMSAAPLALPNLACVIVTTDVTRRKQTEQALQQANDRLSLAQRAANAGLWDWDMTSNSFNWSPELIELFGLAPSTKPDSDLWFNIIHQQDKERAKNNFKDFADRVDARINDEYRIVQSSSNEVRWVNIVGDILRNEQGEPVHTAGIFIDITARKQAEQALHESERNLRIFFETMTEGMALNEIIYNENGEMVDYRILDVNPTFYNTADFSNTQVIGSLATDLYGISSETIKTFWQVHKNTSTTTYTEMFSPLNHRWFYIATSPFIEGKFVTSFLDITAQKEREEQLIQVNESLSMAQRAANAGLWDWEMTQDFYVWSPELFKLFGLEPTIVPNAQIWNNSIHEQDREHAIEHIRTSLREQLPIDDEYRIVRPSGEVRWVKVMGNTTYDQQGQPKRMAGICIDITASKQTENALVESEARLKGIVVSAMDGIVMVDSNQRITLFNQSAEKMFGISAGSAIGQPLDFILPQNKHSLHKKHIEQFGKTGITTRSMSALMDITATRASGASFPIEASISQFIANGQKFYTAILRDITERKQMEENLRASLLEKEALLKEVHHRVKNNLQIVSSLLSMQANSAKDEKVSHALEESKNRVRAMALIHEKLYRSENLEYIQAEEYIPELTNHLTGSLIGHDRMGIKFDLQIAHVTFDIGKAIPCGMIITELVSNALKYAFPANQPGIIKVHLDVEAENGRIRLMVSDNGIGLPPQIDYNRPDTLGLELVSILSRQLKANLQVIREPGTTFILTFRN